MSPSNDSDVSNDTFGLSDPAPTDFHRSTISGDIHDASLQHLISTAVLASTAFRLRDQDGLTEAMRLLVEAVRPFEVGTDDD